MTKRKASKKKLKKVPRKPQAKVNWRKVLSKQTKTVLIDTLLGIIKDDRTIERRLVQRFNVKQSPGSLVEATRRAIADATAYDPRRMNTNFDYDWDAYQTVQKNFATMVKGGQLETAMELSIELMKSGSEQVEMSDEGDMTYVIEDCLGVVIKAVKSSDLPAKTVKAWVQKMKRADRVQFICDEEFGALAGHF